MPTIAFDRKLQPAHRPSVVWGYSNDVRGPVDWKSVVGDAQCQLATLGTSTIRRKGEKVLDESFGRLTRGLAAA